jgi:hypothetical protein
MRQLSCHTLWLLISLVLADFGALRLLGQLMHPVASFVCTWVPAFVQVS